MNNEIELKLLIPPEEVQRFQRHPLLRSLTQQKFPPQPLLSIYYDTPDWTLHQNRIALRLRQSGRRWIQTIKTEGRVAAGLHERPEWECETTQGSLRFDTLPDPEVRQFFSDEQLRRTLQPIFVTEFTRTRRLLSLSNGSVVECALDRGEIRAGDTRLPICEVELELKSGTPLELFTFALQLQETISLKLENVSKAERGYRLAAQAGLVPVKASTPTLEKSLSVQEAFARILNSCLLHLQANVDGIIQSDDPEFVHQVRVALRRARAAARVFSPILSPDKVGVVREELRWLAGALNDARNWDVFVSSTLPPILAAWPGHQGLSWLQQRSIEMRRAAYKQVSDAVKSPRYQRFLLTLGAWICTLTEPDAHLSTTDTSEETPLLPLTAAILKKYHKQLKKRGAALVDLTPAERHAMRITVKKLRYAAEFFSSLYPHKRTQKYLNTLAALQDVLGILNDGVTTEALLHDISVKENTAAYQHPEGIVLGWTQGINSARLPELIWTWKAFRARKPFWR